MHNTIMLTLAIAGSYTLLLFISLFLDPKTRGAAERYSLLHLLMFSTLKMLVVIGLVLTVALLGKKDLARALGFSGFSVNWQGLGLGVLAAFGFIVIYVFWQAIAARFGAKGRARNAESGMISMLPKRWLPLIGLFVVISMEAGLLEEIFFRGIMQSHVAYYMTMPWAVIICGILFGIAHFYQGVSGVIGTSVMGIWLGLAFAVTGNVLVPVLGHILGDFSCMMLGARSIMSRKNTTQ